MGGFKASPLSIAVPEGAFKEWVDEEVTRRNRTAHGQGGHPGTSTSSGWNWPKVNRLTVQDLTGQGREWVDFLGLKTGLQSSYGFTRNYQEIRERIDENVSRFIVSAPPGKKPAVVVYLELARLLTSPISISGELHAVDDGFGVLLAVSSVVPAFSSGTGVVPPLTTHHLFPPLPSRCERPESLVGTVVILGIMDWFIQFSARTSLDRQVKLLSSLVLFFPSKARD